MLAKIGEKILRKCGFAHTHPHGLNFDARYKHLSALYCLSDYLPYETYDESHGLYLNRGTVGFLLEFSPLVGASEQNQEEINNLFQTVLPEMSSVQFFLWADPNIFPITKAFIDCRSATSIEALKILATKRASYLHQQGLRNFRSFVAVSLEKQTFLEEAVTIKKQVMATLSMVGTNPLEVTPSAFITLVNSWLTSDSEESL